MSRFAALAGIGRFGTNTQNPEIARQFPRVIIRGPSGNCVSVPMMSGGGGADKPRTFDEVHQFDQTLSQTAIAWTRNEIVIPTRTSLVIVGEHLHAWQPVPQPLGEGRKTNDAAFNVGNNEFLSLYNMFDGFNWKICNWSVGAADVWGVKRMPGGEVFWTGFTRTFKVLKNYGAYVGQDPFRTSSQTNPSVSGWKPLGGAVGGAALEPNYSPHYQGAPGNELLLGGILHDGADVLNESTTLVDIAFFRDSIYAVTQFGGVCLKYGGKGTYLWTEKLLDDSRVGDPTESSYTDGRLTDNLTGGSKGRCFAEHNGQLFILSNDGKVHVVRPDTLRQTADLTTLGTHSASGILGGTLGSVGAGYAGSNVRRCFLTSYNNQLHAFLNFNSTFNVAKGTRGTETGRGVLWATSFDGINWTDQSPNLPTSGIHSPSGGGVTAGNPKIQVTNWLNFTQPYKFSGFTGKSVIPIPNASGAYPAGYGAQGIGDKNLASGIEPAQPSGFIQQDMPLWTSGNLLETNNKPFNQMTVPLEFGAMGRYLYPTDVIYPANFSYQDPFNGGPLDQNQGGVFRPSGVGSSGLDYTGCEQYHISGYVDDQKNILELSFTNDLAQDGGTLFLQLNAASGWIQRNHLVNSRQTNGYIPIMLYDPEISIPSGSLRSPNPAIDEVNKTVTLDYRVYDWPFWDKVDVVSEYSLDYGQNWLTIGRQKNLSTGSLATDPSGVKGVKQTLVWNYADSQNALSKNQFFPHVQIRLTAIDPDFDPKELSS